jgi:hypothetical protein
MTEPTPRTEALTRLTDAISGERRDWHNVEVRPDDLAVLLAQARTEALDEPCLYPGCGYNALHTARVEP